MESSTSFLNPDSIGGTIDVSNNPSECSSQEEILAADCSTSISEKYDDIIEIFPTVSNGVFNIYSNELNTFKPSDISVYDAIGREVEFECYGDILHIKSQKNGIYFVRFNMGDENVVLKKLDMVE
ncbi:MAG: T9SS type A sorting domain-containing protein [Saprospiraceae bacterium]